MKLSKFIIWAIILLFLTGCAESYVYRRRTYIEAHPDLPEQTKQDIKDGMIRIGMTKEDVRASWGDPNEISSSISSYGETETWKYDWSVEVQSVYIRNVGFTPGYYKPNYQHVTFTNGKVSNIYSSDGAAYVTPAIPIR